MKFIVGCAGFILLAASARAHTPEGCATYTWDLAREFSALTSTGRTVVADGGASTGKRWLAIGKRYDATLRPQAEVAFVAPPASARTTEGSAAGLLFFRSARAGRYRIALSTHHWIDLLDGAEPIHSSAHEGRSGCEPLHKVVEFDLPAKRALTIQLSGAAARRVSVVITGPSG
jgi:hypothetical protein